MAHNIDRRSGIGGSEQPIVVLGECYGRNRQHLANEKTGLVDRPDLSGVRDIKRGNDLEPTIIRRVEEVTGGTISHQQFEVGEGVLYGHIDGILECSLGRFLVEAKAPRMKTVWRCSDTGALDHYVIQANQYVYLLERAGHAVDGYMICVWSCDQWDVDFYEGTKDEALIGEMLEKSEKFWTRCVLGNELASEVFETDTAVAVPRVGGMGCAATPKIESLARDLHLVSSVEKIQKEQAGKIKDAILSEWPTQENGQPYRKIRIDGLGTLTVSPTNKGLSVRTRWSDKI